MDLSGYHKIRLKNIDSSYTQLQISVIKYFCKLQISQSSQNCNKVFLTAAQVQDLTPRNYEQIENYEKIMINQNHRNLELHGNFYTLSQFLRIFQ